MVKFAGILLLSCSMHSIMEQHLTVDDKIEIYRSTLELAIVDKKIPYYEWIKYDVTPRHDTLRIISSANIEQALIPTVSIGLKCLYPEEIQLLADIEGNFLYIFFDHPPDLKDSVVTVRISSAWAKHKDSGINYDTEGGLMIDFHKESNKWVIKKYIPIVQTHSSNWRIEDYINRKSLD